MPTLTHYNDEPTLLDQLDRLDLVRLVGDTVAQCTPPAVMGVHGDWGCGKTSFLYQLHYYLAGLCPQGGVSDDNKSSPVTKRIVERLEHAIKVVDPDWKPAPNVTVVWFEAWRYQHEQAPVVALLQEIAAQLSWRLKWLKRGRKYAEVAVRGALLSLEDITKRIGFQASKIEQAGREWEQENLAVKLPSHAVREQLEHTIAQIIKGGQDTARVVVLIDDLDRCESEVAFRLLEGIKVYLNLRNCVFVLGMDQRVIEDHIAARQAPQANTPDASAAYRAREYLGKICQNVWHLPLAPDPAGLLKAYLRDARSGKAVAEVVRQFNCLPANPRKIKAFANTMLHYSRALAQRLPAEILDPASREAKLAVLMAYLYHFHPEIYRRIEGFPKFYQRVVEWALTGAPSKHEAFEGLVPALQSDSPESAYPDPAMGNVLRAQALIRDLGAVTTDEIRRFLVLQSLPEPPTAAQNSETTT